MHYSQSERHLILCFFKFQFLVSIAFNNVSLKERLQWQPRKWICILQFSISPSRAFTAGWWLLRSAVKALEQHTQISRRILGISQRIQKWVLLIVWLNTDVEYGKPLLLFLWGGQMTIWILYLALKNAKLSAQPAACNRFVATWVVSGATAALPKGS